MATAEISQPRRWWVRSRAWVGIVIIAPFAAAGLFSSPLVLVESWYHCCLETAGWVLFLAGALLRWWATLYIGGRKYHQLVSEGPYSICRNPLYLGTFFLCLSIPLYLGTLTFAVGLAVASAVYLSITVPVEEANLRGHLGPAFDEYCRRTPRFIPHLFRYRSARYVEVDTHGLLAEAWRASRYLWIPAICEIIAYARDEAWWPHHWHLP
jgi:protein-S-isoprenylcysteine O-methyltransferase Ste14